MTQTGPPSKKRWIVRFNPCHDLGPFAVDAPHQGNGLGTALLKNALLRTIQAADIAGICCLLVHAKYDSARQWYSAFDFEISPTDPYQLMLLLKDMKAILA